MLRCAWRVVLAVLFAMSAASVSACSPERDEPKGTVPPPDVAAPPSDAQITASGLAYRVLSRGSGGRRPTDSSRVVVNYTGWTTDGAIIEGVPIGSPPVTVDLSGNEITRGWREALRLMAPGDKFRFWIPAHLSYQNQPGKPQGMLVYDIYLIDFAR
jgi:FKBP-type peptidyl-prolyl cis-trans isomerase